MSGSLTIIPTPIDNESSLVPETKQLLLDACKRDDIIAVEEAKPARRRWLQWGLPREQIEKFVLYNEHNQKELVNDLVASMQKGRRIYLLSDCGLPAFCDPGQYLVDACHKLGITVSASYFANSIVLALALSGFPHNKFIFHGFLPSKGKERKKAIKDLLHEKEVSIVMDTPYRLSSLLEGMLELADTRQGQREVFLACDLNKKSEYCVRAPLGQLKKHLPQEKQEFILVLNK